MIYRIFHDVVEAGGRCDSVSDAINSSGDGSGEGVSTRFPTGCFGLWDKWARRKTTLMRMAGLLAPDTGTVAFDGQVVMDRQVSMA